MLQQLTEQEWQAFIKSFAKRLRIAREEADYTSQTAAARAMRVSRDRIRLHESGNIEPKLSDLVAYAIAYNKPPEYFFSGLVPNQKQDRSAPVKR
jgi:transcriptional regulator with XRE-family HTH domain